MNEPGRVATKGREQLASFSCLKCELLHLHHYHTRAQAQADIFSYIEAFYNTLRPPSALGWIAPQDFAARLLHAA